MTMPLNPQKAIEYKKKLSEKARGKKLSIEHRKRLSEAKMGTAGYWSGKKRKPFTQEWKKNISMGLLRAYSEGKRTINGFQFFIKNNPNKGKFGKEHPCFKKNKKHPFHKLIRETFKYRQWRSDIFARDNFICVLCGRKGELNADHYPKRFIDIINEYKIKTLDEAVNCEEMWNVNNGRTLCVNCHRKTDTWGRLSKR